MIGHAAFACEKLNEPIDPAACEFDPSCFDWPGLWFDSWKLNELIIKVISLDPSKGRVDKIGDYSAIVLYGRDKTGLEYVEADLARRPVERICHDLAAWAKWFNPDAVAVETNQFQELLLSPLQEAAKAAGIVTLPTYRIDNMVPKQVRIRRLSAPLSQKRLRFKSRSPGTQLMVQQLRDWPQGDYDDGADALEMARRLAIELLNKGGKRR